MKLLVLIAILLAGCLLGVAGLHLWEKRSEGDHGYFFRGGDHGGQSRLAQRLGMSEEQQAKLKAIFDESRGEINASRAEMERKMDEIRSRTNGKIMAILTDEQKKRFEQFLKQAESRRTPEQQDRRHDGSEFDH